MWSFVGLKRNKRNKQWIWLALDSDSREIVTLSFSKKIEAHTGVIWNFIHYYNAEIAPKLAITTY